MAHTPYGYQIINGKAVVDEEKANQLKVLFETYIEGASFKVAAEIVGIMLSHSSIGKLLRNEKYLGTDFYPAIIDKVVFEAAEVERMKRARALGRIYKHDKEENSQSSKCNFKIGRIEQKYDDPFRQAEYAYSLIESEEINE